MFPCTETQLAIFATGLLIAVILALHLIFNKDERI